MGNAGNSLLDDSDEIYPACFSQGTLVAQTSLGLTLPSPAVPAVGNKCKLPSTKAAAVIIDECSNEQFIAAAYE